VTSSVATGGIGGPRPHQTNFQAPQLNYETSGFFITINQWIFYQILECQATLHKRKASLFKRPSGDGSVGNGRRQGITLLTCNWKKPRGVVLKNRCGNRSPTNTKEHCAK